ncbi:MAG TPA: adenosine deaminase [Dongiaceae bacterium]|nr:adenosine deaminase [Dongiaceae bacterium]
MSGSAPTADLAAPLRAIPKAEIHLHLEGSIDLETLLDLRARRGEPADAGSRARLESLYRHRDFPDFLGHFRDLCSELRAPEDFVLAVRGLAARLARDNVRHAEVMCSPGIFARRGLPAGELLDAVTGAADAVETAGGPRLCFILDGVRQWGPPAVEELVALASASRSPRVIGIGIGGDETAWPAEAFAPAYREARRLGLRTTAHAGEFDGARSVWEAMEVLEVDRIGHGIRAVEDRVLMRTLAERGLPLECCPTSNLATGVVAGWEAHPIPTLARAGLRLTVNTDDPAMFGTTLLDEWLALQGRLGLSTDLLLGIGRATIEAAFLPDPERSALLAEHDAAVATLFPPPGAAGEGRR